MIGNPVVLIIADSRNVVGNGNIALFCAHEIRGAPPSVAGMNPAGKFDSAWLPIPVGAGTLTVVLSAENTKSYCSPAVTLTGAVKFNV
jgi:hypothetical protein